MLVKQQQIPGGFMKTAALISFLLTASTFSSVFAQTRSEGPSNTRSEGPSNTRSEPNCITVHDKHFCVGDRVVDPWAKKESAIFGSIASIDPINGRTVKLDDGSTESDAYNIERGGYRPFFLASDFV